MRERAEDKLVYAPRRDARARSGRRTTSGGGRDRLRRPAGRARRSSSVRPGSTHRPRHAGAQAAADAGRSRRSLSGQRVLDVNPYDDVSFPLGIMRRSDPVRGVRSRSSRAAMSSALLRGAVYAGTRAHASEGRHPRGGRRGRRKRPQGSAAARPDREPLPGAGRSVAAISRSCSRPVTTSRASTGSASPARIRVTSTRGS